MVHFMSYAGIIIVFLVSVVAVDASGYWYRPYPVYKYPSSMYYPTYGYGPYLSARPYSGYGYGYGRPYFDRYLRTPLWYEWRGLW